MRYFCCRDCFFNKQYFHGRRFYTDDDLRRGLAPGDLAAPASKFMVQIEPMPKSRGLEEQALLDAATAELEAEIRELKRLTQDSSVKGALRLLESSEKILENILGGKK